MIVISTMAQTVKSTKIYELKGMKGMRLIIVADFLLPLGVYTVLLYVYT